MREPSFREIRRYLGMNSTDPETDRLIAECIAKLNSVIDPRCVCRCFDLSFENGYPVIEGHVLESCDLAKNLKDCTRVVLFACTIGAGADRLLNRSRFTSIAKAAVMQAAAAAMIEAYADEINMQIREDMLEKGLYVRPRFSCGYGDLKLETQKLIFSLLDPAKNAGITLTDSLLMVPVKSVTAFIGISEKPAYCSGGCASCNMHDTCLYRKDETNETDTGKTE